jgi:hypothetical protein
MRKIAGMVLGVFLGFAPSANAAPASGWCTPNSVQSDNNIVAIRCPELSSLWFAVELTHAQAPNLREMGMASITTGKKLFIFFESTTSANPPGCSSLDCRRLLTVRYEK